LTNPKRHNNGEKKGDFAMKSLEHLELLAYITNAQVTLEAARQQENAFSRNRKMSFSSAVSFLLDMRKTTLQTRLNVFFQHTQGGEPISQQAFSKLRMKFDHSPFETMVRESVKKEYSGQYKLPTWCGFHVFAVDGSYLQLPRTEELRIEFGVRGGGDLPSAGISVLYDVLHGWPLDPIITHTDMNERTECEKHIRFLCEQLPHIAQNSILTIDRGYPSLDLFKTMQTSGLKFVARCSSACLQEIKAAPMGDSRVTLKNGITMRVVKVTLDSGEIETLATNLFDFPSQAILELYTMRWNIETAYFRLKEELSVQQFSGKTPNAIRQDFWASMVLMQAVAVFQQNADEAVQKRQECKLVKHLNRARTSDLIITLRDRFIFAVLCGRPMFCVKEMEAVINTMARAVSPVRPGRSFKRVTRHFDAVGMNLKSRL
jgi:IS4 transposase